MGSIIPLYAEKEGHRLRDDPIIFNGKRNSPLSEYFFTVQFQNNTIQRKDYFVIEPPCPVGLTP